METNNGNGFKPKNHAWKFRKKDGVDAKYTAKTLGEKFVEYCDWVDHHSDKEEVAFHYQGRVTTHGVSKKTPYSVIHFCLYADIVHQTFLNYKNKVAELKSKKASGKDVKDYDKKLSHAYDLLVVVTHIYDTCYAQKFNGAASGFFNPSIIARDLGLVDKKEIKDKGKKKMEINVRKSRRKPK